MRDGLNCSHCGFSTWLGEQTLASSFSFPVNRNQAKSPQVSTRHKPKSRSKKLDDGYVRRNPTGYLYATLHRPSASIDHLHHGIFVFRSALLPKASARPRMEVRGERSEAAKSLRTSLARRIELVAAGGLVWRGGESTLCSKYDLIDGAAESVESGEAGGYNRRRRRHQLDR